MRCFLPLIVLFLAACNADQPQDSAATASEDTTMAAGTVQGTVQDKANADVEAAMAEAR
jgi:hypothetical protein